MENVIHVNFKTRCRTEVKADELFFGFIDLLRSRGLDEADIREVFDAIRDPSYYETVDDDIKRIVDVWNRETMRI